MSVFGDHPKEMHHPQIGLYSRRGLIGNWVVLCGMKSDLAIDW